MYINKMLIVLLLSVFLFSFAPSVSAPTTGCEIVLSGAGDVKMVTTATGTPFVIRLTGWDTQGTTAYIQVNGVAFTLNEGSTYWIGNVNFYVKSVDVNYTGTQEATASVIILLDQTCTASWCNVNLTGLSTRIVTTSDGNVFVVKLNGWDTWGNKAFLSVNNVSYTLTEGTMLYTSVPNVVFFLDSVEVGYTGTQEMTGVVKMLLNRECTQQEAICTDSDGGLNYYVKGSTSGFYETPPQYITLLDTCMTQPSASGSNVYSGSYIAESYCENGIVKEGFYTCPNGCRDGACVSANQTATCTDSDGGKNYYVKGTAIDNSGQNGYVADSCVSYDYYSNVAVCSGSNCNMIEGYCDGNVPRNVYFTCPDGCRDGACFQAIQCAGFESNTIYFDGIGARNNVKSSDGKTFVMVLNGWDTAATKAYMSINGISYTWIEGDIYTVDGVQFAVDNVDIVWTGSQEGIGHVQIRGCVKEIVDCTDSDGGLNYYVKGKVTSPTAPVATGYEDRCALGQAGNPETANDPNGLYESYCFSDGTGYGYVFYSCPNGCSEGACISQSIICGNGVCEAGETQESCPQDCVRKCPASIDLGFNKKIYYPGDYFEVTVKVYDKDKNLMPNRMFNVYNERDGTTSTFYTDSAGIYKSTSTVPDDSKYNGEWTFAASVSEENCPYVYDKETIYLNISTKCGDGYCDENEKQLECEKVCAICPTSSSAASGGASAYTGSITAVAVQPVECGGCREYCHVRCPKDCTPNCGNGICDTAGPIPESEKNCPQDCKPTNYCGSKSSDPNCICEASYTKESFQEPCEAAQIETQVNAASVTGAVTSATETCTDSDGGKNYYVKGNLIAGPNNRWDKCYEDIEHVGYLEENYCAPDGGMTVEAYKCPNGCRDGACIGGETVKEQVKCVFKNSASTEECYSVDGRFRCKGAGTCVVDVYGKKGERLTWKSTCSGYAYTVVDGENEYANFDCGGARMCTYYRCVPAYVYLYLSTDKYIYDIGEQVKISTNFFQKDQVNLTELQVSVKDPYGNSETITLKPVCEGGGECPACVPSEYCPPCKSFTSCVFKGIYTDTKSVGFYGISSLYTGSDITIQPTLFSVYDYELLKKYLILNDIDGFKYIMGWGGKTPQYENSNIATYAAAYIATYEKNGMAYAAMVLEFEDREKLEKLLSDAFRYTPPNEEKMDGYYVYVIKSGSDKIYIWTYKTFVIITALSSYPSSGMAAKSLTLPETTNERATAKESVKTGPAETAESPGFFTGMITGMPVARAETYCGSDSAYPECVCKGDEVKESFMPPCKEGTCGTHYRCRQQAPTELIKAYLGKYPSDIKATGTECEQKDGYCISSEDSCRADFEEMGFACKTNAEKCCVQTVDKSDFLEIVMKLEGMRVKMDGLERQANALADYYKSVGDDERANKFSDVAGMFGEAKKMIDDIIAKIRANLENPEAIRDEVKTDIAELRDYINKEVLKRMVS